MSTRYQVKKNLIVAQTITKAYCFTTGEINPEAQLYASSACLHLHTWDCLQKLKLENEILVFNRTSNIT